MHSQRDWLLRLGLVAGALAALVILAAGLSAPMWRSGWTASDFWRSSPADGGVGLDLRWGTILIAAGLLLLLAMVVASAVMAARSGRPLPRARYSVLSVVLMLLVLTLIRPDILERLRIAPLPSAVPSAAGTPAPAASGPAVPAALPGALVYGVSLLAATVVVVSFWLVWRAVHRPKPQAEEPVAQQAAQAARMALADWQSGSPLASVIIRCYREMSELVAEKRALQRASDMTPREFVQRMEKVGVPAVPAEQLTALFELARYSVQPLGPSEEATARACLNSLAQALEKAA